MTAFRFVAVAAVLTWGLVAPGHASYETWPDLRPEVRCADIPPGIGDPDDPGGVDSIHCQRLFWDLPMVTELGTVVVGAPFHEDRVPRFPNGLTDRPPPLYIDSEGKGHEKAGPGRTPLCEDPDEIPYWKRLVDEDGQPVIGTDGFGYSSVYDPGQPQEGPLYELACRRGSRSYIGPWQTGMQEDVYDRLTNNRAVRFENTERLNRDVEAGRTTEVPTADGGLGRVEWNVGSEFYNHFSSHHGTCYNGFHDVCGNPENPQPREAFDDTDPDATCRGYQRRADPPEHPEGKGDCYAGSEDPSCDMSFQAYRMATQYPGRASLAFPEGRGMLGVEDQLWGCNHHVVTQLPPGSYGMRTLQNYRYQTRGVVNTTDRTIYDTAPGEYFGGAAGQYIIQYFTEPANADVKPINLMFNALPDFATTAYPPFTWNYHESHWYAPFDIAIGRATIHSHHRMVKGTMSLSGGHAPRLNSPDPECGGWASGETPVDLYTGWDWEDSKVCEYWSEPDGPVIMRKGQVLRTSCFVNNGVTPEAIKNGLVAEGVVEALRNAGAPIPPRPETVPTSQWSDLLVSSPIGEQFLYGTHPPENYRVVYKCGAAGGPVASSPTGNVCDPNPAVDADGDYIDGPYQNDKQCGGDWCNPSTIMFRCVAEDEMCIGVSLYWALDRLGNPESGDAAMEHLQSGDVDKTGTPGALPKSPGDLGICHQCDNGPGGLSGPGL